VGDGTAKHGTARRQPGTFVVLVCKNEPVKILFSASIAPKPPENSAILAQ
jgi:hypothetical protein